jgi:dTDP-4-amino-4,6-dideoxygalactose transaminase
MTESPSTLNIPMSSPDLTPAELAAVAEVIGGSRLSLGPWLERFEKAVAGEVGVVHGIGVNSGTSGLHLCVIAAGIGEGDFVITTPFSFVASANCILYERGIPLFVDVDPITGNIDPALASEAAGALSRGGEAARQLLPPALQNEGKGGQLRAILPVHAFGQPADMDPLLETAREHDLVVIEDACEAIGASYKGRPAGSLGGAAVFAFYPNKQVTSGEGGMIVTDNERWAGLFRSLRNQGRDIFNAWLSHARLGYNYRLDELSAALGATQMERITELLARRAQVAAWYEERLADIEFLETPAVAKTTSRMSWFVYVVRLGQSVMRDEVMRRLADDGIPSRPYFTPIHLQPFYRERFGYKRGDFPVTEHLGDVSLALPFSSIMTENQVEHVCAALKAAARA